MVKSANRMEAAGLVTRRRDAADRRLVRIYLTEHARSVREAVQEARVDLAEYATATLTDAERRHLAGALKKIIAQMTEPAAHRVGPDRVA